ncbi:hypothetical protein [Vibrio mediterranei]|uniref:hypothetical protein n=1 Tax=Vibrio mediterranei TaxID=689 RepID=UPI004068CE20
MIEEERFEGDALLPPASYIAYMLFECRKRQLKVLASNKVSFYEYSMLQVIIRAHNKTEVTQYLLKQIMLTDSSRISKAVKALIEVGFVSYADGDSDSDGDSKPFKKRPLVPTIEGRKFSADMFDRSFEMSTENLPPERKQFVVDMIMNVRYERNYFHDVYEAIIEVEKSIGTKWK